MSRYSSELLWSTLSQTIIHGEKLSKSRRKLISTHRAPLKLNILHVCSLSIYSLCISASFHLRYNWHAWCFSNVNSVSFWGIFRSSYDHPMRSRRICSMSEDGLMRMPLKSTSTSGRISISLFDLIFALNIRRILSLLLHSTRIV